MVERVILVDKRDQEIGTMEKMEAHQKALLHRAFSVFALRGGQMLLQRRALSKYHCGGLWTNSCCSHPRPGEEIGAAALRRTAEELGAAPSNLQELYSFTYKAVFENGLTEHELDHVFACSLDAAALSPDADEVAEIRWVDFDALLVELESSPEWFTPWFRMAAPRVVEWAQAQRGASR